MSILTGLKARAVRRAGAWAMGRVVATSEWPRRVLSRTIYNEMIGFRDSTMDLGDEQVPLHEEEYIERIIEILEARHLRDYPSGVRPMPRDFHGKAHGCVRALFTVESFLPAEVKHGVFAIPGPHRAVVRFSNASRDIASDKLPNQHGLAIKLIMNDGAHQDFVLSDYPVNFISDAEQAYYFYRAEAANKPLSYFLRHFDKFAITLLGSSYAPPVDVFDMWYFSQTPYRLGPKRACKYMVRPLRADGSVVDRPANAEPEGPQGRNFLREQMVKRFADLKTGEHIEFAFFVQPQRHPIRQPVEDASFEWDEREAPPIRVGTLRLAPDSSLPFTSPEAQWHAEEISFNPARAFPENQPIGGLNRVRRAVYQKFAEMRFKANGTHERTGEAALPPPYPLPDLTPKG